MITNLDKNQNLCYNIYIKDKEIKMIAIIIVIIIVATIIFINKMGDL